LTLTAKIPVGQYPDDVLSLPVRTVQVESGIGAVAPEGAQGEFEHNALNEALKFVDVYEYPSAAPFLYYVGNQFFRNFFEKQKRPNPNGRCSDSDVGVALLNPVKERANNNL